MGLRFMDNFKDDKYYIDKILIDIKFIIKKMENVDKQEFSFNELLQDSMMFRLIQLSENSIKISGKCKNENNEIPWNAIKGLRNRIVHDYGNVDLTIVFDTLKNDIPYIFALLRQL